MIGIQCTSCDGDVRSSLYQIIMTIACDSLSSAAPNKAMLFNFMVATCSLSLLNEGEKAVETDATIDRRVVDRACWSVSVLTASSYLCSMCSKLQASSLYVVGM